jgi:hypothetical protein
MAGRFEMWRGMFLVGGALIMAGGPKHPRGEMLEMLSHPDWFMSHALVMLGYGALLAGLLMFSRTPGNAPALRRWTKLAIAGTGLMTLEMAVHTAAMVDAGHLAAGHATPVLTTHLAMSVVFYPAFAITSAFFMIAAARQRAIGSPAFAWIGVIGTLANGIAPILVGVFGMMQARILFAFVLGVALWMVLAALWPSRAAAPAVSAPTAA